MVQPVPVLLLYVSSCCGLQRIFDTSDAADECSGGAARASASDAACWLQASADVEQRYGDFNATALHYAVEKKQAAIVSTNH